MSEETYTTARKAAQAIGVGAQAVEGWRADGSISPTGPWTREELLAVKEGRWPYDGRSSAPHGTTDSWRSGCSCDACTHAHNEESRSLTQRRRDERLDPIWDRLLDDIANGAQYADACKRHGLTARGVSLMARADPDRRVALDAALLLGRDPKITHGIPAGYRRRCRCPECRRAVEKWK